MSEQPSVTTPPSDEGEGSKICPFISTMVMQTLVEQKSALAIAASGPPQVAQTKAHALSACVQGDCELWNAEHKRCNISVIAETLLSKVPAPVGESA